jgi:hypothetical protein
MMVNKSTISTKGRANSHIKSLKETTIFLAGNSKDANLLLIQWLIYRTEFYLFTATNKLMSDHLNID